MTEKYELLLSVPWGEEESELHPRYFTQPDDGLLSPERARQVFAPLRFRLDPDKGIHILNLPSGDDANSDQVYVSHFSSTGKFIRKTRLPSPIAAAKNIAIKDFAVDKQLNVYVLESAESGGIRYNCLFRLNKDGGREWEVVNPILRGADRDDCLGGELEMLLCNGSSHLYLPCVGQAGSVAQLCASSGEVTKVHNLAPGIESTYILDNKLISVKYFETRRRRGFTCYDPGSGNSTSAVAEKDVFGMLLYSFGFDGERNCYTFKIPNVYDHPALVKISFEGAVLREQPFKDLVVRSSDGVIFSAYPNGAILTIRSHQSAPENQWQLRLPERYLLDQMDNVKLTRVDEQNRFYVLVTEIVGAVAVLLVFDKYGELQQELYPKTVLDIESSLQNQTTWQVDQQGNIYFPLVDPEGFKIVRLNYSY